MLVVYEGVNEVFVCKPKKEHELLQVYFSSNCGRDLEQYDRYEVKDNVVVVRRGRLKTNTGDDPSRVWNA